MVYSILQPIVKAGQYRGEGGPNKLAKRPFYSEKITIILHTANETPCCV